MNNNKKSYLNVSYLLYIAPTSCLTETAILKKWNQVRFQAFVLPSCREIIEVQVIFIENIFKKNLMFHPKVLVSFFGFKLGPVDDLIPNRLFD